MKFSIVTPSFNQGRFIRDCIESVLSQGERDWEHIVTDARSTDGTLEILKGYPHLKWSSEPDKGMSDGINKGFLQAQGDWVMWLNTDDYLLPGALERVVEHARLHPEADIIYGECLFVDEHKNVLRRRHEHEFDPRVLLFYGCYIPSTSTFIRRRVVEAGHLLDVDYRVCMDFDLYVRLSQAGYRFSFLPEPLAGFRWHGENTSLVQKQRRLEERWRIQCEALRKEGKAWMCSPSLLRVLCRVYQVKRAFLRRRARAS